MKNAGLKSRLAVLEKLVQQLKEKQKEIFYIWGCGPEVERKIKEAEAAGKVVYHFSWEGETEEMTKRLCGPVEQNPSWGIRLGQELDRQLKGDVPKSAEELNQQIRSEVSQLEEAKVTRPEILETLKEWPAREDEILDPEREAKFQPEKESPPWKIDDSISQLIGGKRKRKWNISEDN